MSSKTVPEALTAPRRLRTMRTMAQTDDITRRLGQRIRRARLAREMSLAEVAALTGRNATHLWKIEQGMIPNLPVPTLRLLAKALRVTPGRLLNDRTA